MICISLKRKDNFCLLLSILDTAEKQRYGSSTKAIYTDRVPDGTMMMLVMMAKVKAPYVYDDTGIKKELDGRKDLYNRQKRQNTECFDDNHFPSCRKQDCNKRQHVQNWLIYYSYCIYIWGHKQNTIHNVPSDGGVVKLTEPRVCQKVH